MHSVSVTTTFGIHVAIHSEIRYQARATRFHFLRLRSRPSTLSATGIRKNTRGIQVKMAFAALQYSSASCRQPSTCSVETQVGAVVSRYLGRQVRRNLSRTPR